MANNYDLIRVKNFKLMLARRKTDNETLIYEHSHFAVNGSGFIHADADISHDVTRCFIL